MTEDLKPCPFCNGKANLRSVRVDEDSYIYQISCSNPKCFCSSALFYLTLEEAVADWNNRPLEKENKRLKKKLDEALRQRDFNAGLALGFQDRVKQMREALEHAATTDTTVDEYGIWRIDGKTFQTWAVDVLKGELNDDK